MPFHHLRSCSFCPWNLGFQIVPGKCLRLFSMLVIAAAECINFWWTGFLRAQGDRNGMQ